MDGSRGILRAWLHLGHRRFTSATPSQSTLCNNPPASLHSPRRLRIVGHVCIGPIDPSPNPKLVEEGRPNTTFACATSDAFFERPEIGVRAQGSQRALIDGDRSCAKALRDFENLEALAAPNSIIAIHDMDARTATSKAETAFHWPRYSTPGFLQPTKPSPKSVVVQCGNKCPVLRFCVLGA